MTADPETHAEVTEAHLQAAHALFRESYGWTERLILVDPAPIRAAAQAIADAEKRGAENAVGKIEALRDSQEDENGDYGRAIRDILERLTCDASDECSHALCRDVTGACNDAIRARGNK